jgi:hypothetical protein
VNFWFEDVFFKRTKEKKEFEIFFIDKRLGMHPNTLLSEAEKKAGQNAETYRAGLQCVSKI